MGGFYNELHGDYEGILRPHVFEFNSMAVPENKILRLAQVMGVSAESKPEAVEKTIGLMRKLTADIDIPQGLKKI